MTATELRKELNSKLSHSYSSEEIQWMHRHLLSHCFGMDFSQTLFPPSSELDTDACILYKSIAEELSNGTPLQYAIGYTEFLDCKIQLAPGVLIPRPETEEIISHIIQDIGDQNLSVLDIGTGSGCIPIAIAAHCPMAKLTAFDISDSALNIASKNAIENKQEISFREIDILNWEKYSFDQSYDIIISNPPYVTEKERALMQPNVLDHEPELALFVPDDNPLLFYKKIADFADHNLKQGGYLYFEINEQFGEATKQMLQQKGFSGIEINKDMQGKDRWTKCVKHTNNSI